MIFFTAQGVSYSLPNCIIEVVTTEKLIIMGQTCRHQMSCFAVPLRVSDVDNCRTGVPYLMAQNIKYVCKALK